jgi:uncharacterized membrane protein YfcA
MVELLFFALLISSIFSSVGLGGGMLLVPLLLWSGLSIHQAIGTSLFAIWVVSCSATVGYALQRRIDYRVGLLLDSLDVPGGIVGAYLTVLFSKHLLRMAFGAMLVLISPYLIVRKREGTTSLPPLTTRLILISVLGSFLSGLASGFFGIGGGIVDELVMLLALGMSIKLSAGTAMFGMALTTGAAFLPHLFLGHFSLPHALLLAIGCAIGGQLGARISKRLPAPVLRMVLGVVIAFVGVGIAFGVL